MTLEGRLTARVPGSLAPVPDAARIMCAGAAPATAPSRSSARGPSCPVPTALASKS